MSNAPPIRAAGLAPFRFTAPVELRAAGGQGDRPTFTILAYTGAAMRVAGYYAPVVVDLATARSAPVVPVLRDHDPGRIVGHTTRVQITPQRIAAAGVVSAENEHAADVLTLGRNGFGWQASIGAEPGRIEHVESGKRVSVNGRSFTGPVLVARDTDIKEISFVAIGADGGTSAAVAAQGGVMTFEQWLQARGFDAAALTEQQRSALLAAYNAECGGSDPVQEERRRQARIVQVCAGEWGDRAGQVEQLRAQAVAGTLSVEQLQGELLTLIRTNRTCQPTYHRRPEEGAGEPAVIEAGMLLAQGVPAARVAGWYGQQATDRATGPEYRNLGPQGLLRFVLRAAGEAPPSGRFGDSAVRLAFEAGARLRATGFSMLSVGGVLSNVANKLLLQAFEAAPTAWRTFCRVGADLKDFKAGKRYRLTGIGQFEELPPDGEIKHLSLQDSEYDQQLKTFAGMLTMTRRDLINDDLGALASVPASLGRLSAVSLERAAFTLLLANTGSFFHATNKNLKTGAGSALADAGLAAAFQALAEQVDENGDPALIVPRVLLYPPALDTTARKLLVSQTLAVAGGTDLVQVPSANVWAGRFEPVCAPYLGTAAGLAGASNTAWYLLAGPGDFSVIEVAFLNGQQSPIIEQGATDFNTLGLSFRAYHDFGVAFLEPKGGVKNAGA